MNTPPIILPMPMPARARDCIMVEGAKYCRDSDLDPSVFGWSILGIVVIAMWLLGSTHFLLDGRPEMRRLGFYLLFGVPVAVGLTLVLL